MRLLSFFTWLIISTSVFAATGDILSVAINSDGWTADIKIEGKTINGTYDLGWSSSIKGDLTSGTFQAGETVTQTGSGATAIAWGAADNYSVATTDLLWIYSTSLSGSPSNSGTWVGGTSGAVFTPTEKPVFKAMPSRSSPKITFTVVSLGYDDFGNLSTLSRTVYGTKQLRKPWPDNAFNQETIDGGDVIVKVTLSELVYEKDDSGSGNSGTAPVVTILSNFYTQSGGNNASGSSFPVTNNSTVAYQPVVMNWSWPGYQKMDASTKLRALAFHRNATQGRPVRCIKFSVTDGISTNTEIVTNMTRGHDFGDAVKVIEYVSTSDLTSGLTQGAELTCNFTAYPWVGDNAQSSSTGAAAPSPLVGPIKGVCDRLGTYGVAYAVVDPVGGSDPVDVTITGDSGKWVGNGSGHGSGSGVTAYQSIARAARAIRNYNAANRSPTRDDVGAGIIYLKAGNYNWLGNTITGTYGATPKTWVTIKPFTGVLRDDVVITGNSGNTDISDLVKLEGVKINTTTSNTFAGCLSMWLLNCDLNSTGVATWNTSGQNIWLTQGRVGTFSQGLKGYSTGNISFPLVRGMDLTGFSGNNLIRVTIGNKRSVAAAGGVSFIDYGSGQLAPTPIPILAYNELYGYDVSSGLAVIRTGYVNGHSNTNGLAIVQNLIEVYKGEAGGTGNIASSDGTSITTNTPQDNYMIWHNIFLGERMQIAYNSEGSAIKYRRYWSVRNNYWDNMGIKTDTFEGSVEGPNGNRVGNWTFSFGVDFKDNSNYDIPAISASAFDQDFSGLNCSAPNTDNVTVDTPQFIDRRSKTNIEGLGIGNYRVNAASSFNQLKMDYTIPYDLDGNARDLTNASTGVYVYGDTASTGDAPVLTITSPVNGFSGLSPVALTGTATDTEDGNISSSISWSSNVDGNLGSGASISGNLSVGSHIITASITDSSTNTVTENVSITVTSPPSNTAITGNGAAAGTVLIK